MHVKRVTLESDRYPTTDCYPFNTRLLQQTREIAFGSNIAFFAGENGTGKSTLLEAISHRCGIHIWRDSERRRYQHNRYEQSLRDFIKRGFAALLRKDKKSPLGIQAGISI